MCADPVPAALPVLTLRLYAQAFELTLRAPEMLTAGLSSMAGVAALTPAQAAIAAERERAERAGLYDVRCESIAALESEFRPMALRSWEPRRIERYAMPAAAASMSRCRCLLLLILLFLVVAG